MFSHRARRGMYAALFSALIASAASGSESILSLTLTEAERLALENSPRMQMAADSLVTARAKVTGSRATLLPSISGSAAYTRNVDRNAFYFGGMKMETGAVNDYTIAITGSQPLFLGFAGITSLRMSELGVKTAELQYHETRQSIVDQVRQAYLGAVLNRSLVYVAREALAQADSTLAQVQRRYDVGAASKFDLIRAQVEVATLRPNVISAESNRELADANLRMVMGLESDVTVEPTDELKRFSSRWADMPYDSLLGIAYAHRTDIQQLLNVKRTAQYGVRLAQSSYYPQIAAFGRSSWQQIGPETWDRAVAVGVQLNWNLWDSFGRRSQIQQARVGVRQVESIQRLTEQGIGLQVESAQKTLHEASVSLQSLQETVELAEESLRLARVLYTAGGSTQLDIMNAQLALTQARTQYATALYRYHIAHAQMERALGLVATIDIPSN